MPPTPRPTRAEEKTDLPPLMRFILWAGKPLGIAFVPERFVRVIQRMGKYHGCRGPGLIYYNRLTETLGPLVFVEAQPKEYVLDNVISRDVVPITMHISAMVGYDPQLGPEMAHILTRLPREAHLSIVEIFLRWAVLALANQYNALELTQHAVHAQLEMALSERMAPELNPLGLMLKGKPQVMRVALPASLTERHELLAQRRASILAGTEFHPAEYRRALVTEVIEQLARSGGRESFVNFGEVLEAYAAERGELPAPPRVIEQRPGIIDDRGAARPPDEPPESPGREGRPGSQRPKSRL